MSLFSNCYKNKALITELDSKVKKIEELEEQISEIQSILDNKTKEYKLSIEKCSSSEAYIKKSSHEINKLNSKLEQHQIVNEALSDKVNELNVDNIDKTTLINELTNRYNLELNKLRVTIDNLRIKETEILELNTTLTLELNTIKKTTIIPNTVIYYFVGYNNKIDKVDREYDIKTYMENSVSDVHVINDESMYKSLENIKLGKNLHKIRHTKKIITEAFDNILGDLNNGKKIILIGENYGGALVNRLLDIIIYNHHKIHKLGALDSLFCFTFGSFYNPLRNVIQKSLMKFINSEHIFNYMYKEDIVSKYDVGGIPINIDSENWTMNTKTFIRWKNADTTDYQTIMDKYMVKDTVQQIIKKYNI
jgi:hypothetical protein